MRRPIGLCGSLSAGILWVPLVHAYEWDTRYCCPPEMDPRRSSYTGFKTWLKPVFATTRQ